MYTYTLNKILFQFDNLVYSLPPLNCNDSWRALLTALTLHTFLTPKKGYKHQKMYTDFTALKKPVRDQHLWHVIDVHRGFQVYMHAQSSIFAPKVCQATIDPLWPTFNIESLSTHSVGFFQIKRVLGSGSALQRNPALQHHARSVFNLPMELRERADAPLGAALAAKELLASLQT